MTEEKPLVSVIIPTYFRNERLRETLQNIMDHDYQPLEIIVVDDSGEEYAKSVVSEFPDVLYLGLEENCGANVARTRGVQLSTGKYIQLLDDDDLLEPGKIDKQVSLLERSENIGAVYCGQYFRGIRPSLPNDSDRGDVLEEALSGELTQCVTSTLLVDGQIMRDCLPLPDSPGADDMYIKVELAKRTNFDFVDSPLVVRGDSEDARSGGKNAINGMEGLLDTYAELYEKHPSRVERTLISNIHHRRARYILSEQWFSLKAPYLFLLSVLYSSRIKKAYIGHFFGSLLGRPGLWLTDRIFRLALLIIDFYHKCRYILLSDISN